MLYKKVSILFCKPQPSQDRPRHYAKLHFENNQSGYSRYFDCSSKTATSKTKIGADSLAENIPNAPQFICPIFLLKLKSSGFRWKKVSLGVRSPCNLTWEIRFLHSTTSRPYDEKLLPCPCKTWWISFFLYVSYFSPPTTSQLHSFSPRYTGHLV